VPTEELVWDRWARHSEVTPRAEAIVHWRGGDIPIRWTWGELIPAALAYAERLREHGVRPRDVCAIVLRHHPSFYPIYMGVCAAGAIPAVLAYPNGRLHPEKFAHGLAGMASRSGLDFILTERDLEATVRPLVTGEGTTVRGLLFPLEDKSPRGSIPLGWRPDVSASEPCLLQHSSGTTGLQKGVMLSHRAVLDHVDRYARAIDLAPTDKIVSWLPLYHDMGMIAAFHMALARAIPTIQIDPFEWVAAPDLLLEAASKERATLTWLPNFAYNFLADRVREEELTDVRLDAIRMFVNCSEPVRASSHSKFLARFGPLGARESAMGACYAMAETTFAATQTRPGAPARTLEVDRDALATGRVLPALEGRASRVCVSSGAPISGCEVRVVDEARRPLEPGRVGELAIRSGSLFDGYRNAPDETERVLSAGWYYSGDIGFEWEGEFYLIGRRKDVIIVAGNNVFPEDIEDVVGAVPGVLPGRVVAFGIDDPDSGTEKVGVVAETEVADGPEQRSLATAIVRAGMRINVTIAKVHLVPPRWLIKSSAGKPARKANRERILALSNTKELM
jgi:fatty-acyl-CoA synthase